MNHILSRFLRRFSTYFHEPHSFAYKKPMWFTYHTWTAKSFGFPTKLFLLWWPKWKWYFFSLRRTPPNVLSPAFVLKTKIGHVTVVDTEESTHDDWNHPCSPWPLLGEKFNLLPSTLISLEYMYVISVRLRILSSPFYEIDMWGSEHDKLRQRMPMYSVSVVLKMSPSSYYIRVCWVICISIICIC